MPGARLELAQEFNFPTDFKSVASADSAIRAKLFWLEGTKLHNHESMNALLSHESLRREAESNRRISVLQTDALPLCYRARNTKKY